MSVTALSLLRQEDRLRYVPVLFASAPTRELLAALALLEHEITTIPWRTGNPTLARIRLQWWREALMSTTPAAHPALAVRTGDLDAARVLEPLLTTWEDVVDNTLAPEAAWTRTGITLAEAGLVLLNLDHEGSRRAVATALQARGLALWQRQRRLHGEAVDGLAVAALPSLVAAARTESVDRRALPLLLAATQAEDLYRRLQHGAQGALARVGPGTARLMWRAVRGRY